MKKFLLLFLLSFIYLCMPVQARIDIVPQKIIIENRERNGELTILNLTDTKGTFRVELVSFRQNKNGIYEELSTPLNSAFNPEQIVRFSPRQFSLDSYGRQKVRISLRKPANLPEGEYRFHIKAIRLAQDDEKKQENQKAVSAIANIGVTIPVIIRHGNTTSTAKIDNLNIINATQSASKKTELHLDITREGNASTIGALEILLQDANGREERIGRITNMNIFTDIKTRKVEVPLYKDPTGLGRVIVRYYDTNKKIIDEATLSL